MGVKITKSNFSKKNRYKDHLQQSDDVQTVSKACRAAPSEPQRGPKGDPGHQFWQHFLDILHYLTHGLSKLLLPFTLEPKMTLKVPQNHKFCKEIVLANCANW